MGNFAKETHARRYAQALGQRFQLGAKRTAAGNGQIAIGQAGQGANRQLVALAGDKAAHRQQREAITAGGSDLRGREAVKVDAIAQDDGPIRCRAQQQQPLAQILADSDHRIGLVRGPLNLPPRQGRG